MCFACEWRRALKNKDEIEDYIAYVPEYFEQVEKTEPAVKKFIESYKDFYKRDFPYDQAPMCSSSCYDHVYMLVKAMKKGRHRRRRHEGQADPDGHAL
jgi:branched-chain amino acid transport system substrate-binding protein